VEVAATFTPEGVAILVVAVGLLREGNIRDVQVLAELAEGRRLSCMVASDGPEEGA
jgi:hypothetical protein